jgi:hypothetical protein
LIKKRLWLVRLLLFENCTQPPLKLLVNEFTRVTCQAALRVAQTRRS